MVCVDALVLPRGYPVLGNELKQLFPSGRGVARWVRRRRCRLERHRRAIDVPEITIRVCIGEFDSDSPATARLRFDIDYVAFALFFGEAIDDEELLAEFYAGLHVEQPTV